MTVRQEEGYFDRVAVKSPSTEYAGTLTSPVMLPLAPTVPW